jgi:Lar family restriction alleviation protein
MKKLKPCPFCGEKEDISLKVKRYHGGTVEVEGNKFWFVECLPCDVRTGYCFDLDAPLFGFKDGKEMAISQWNRRVSDEPR